MVPGFGLKIESHQLIHYASVLSLGTMGYQVPEVCIKLVCAVVVSIWYAI